MDKVFNKSIKLKAQLAILNDVKKDYPHRTIENIIQNIQSKLDYITKHSNGTNDLL